MMKNSRKYIFCVFVLGLLGSISTALAQDPTEWLVEAGAEYEYAFSATDSTLEMDLKGDFIVTIESITEGVLTYSIDYDTDLEDFEAVDAESEETELGIDMMSSYPLILTKEDYDALDYSGMFDEVEGDYEGFTISGTSDEKSFDLTISGDVEGLELDMTLIEEWTEEGVLKEPTMETSMTYV